MDEINIIGVECKKNFATFIIITFEFSGVFISTVSIAVIPVPRFLDK